MRYVNAFVAGGNQGANCPGTQKAGNASYRNYCGENGSELDLKTPLLPLSIRVKYGATERECIQLSGECVVILRMD